MSKSISPQIACVLAFKHSQIENFHQKCSQCSWPNHALDLPIFSTVKGTHRLHQNHYPTNPTILPTLPPYHHPAIKFLSPIKRSTTYFFIKYSYKYIYPYILYLRVQIISPLCVSTVPGTCCPDCGCQLPKGILSGRYKTMQTLQNTAKLYTSRQTLQNTANQCKEKTAQYCT